MNILIMHYRLDLHRKCYRKFYLFYLIRGNNKLEKKLSPPCCIYPDLHQLTQWVCVGHNAEVKVWDFALCSSSF